MFGLSEKRFGEIREMKLEEIMDKLEPKELHSVIIIVMLYHLDAQIKPEAQTTIMTNLFNTVSKMLIEISDKKGEGDASKETPTTH